MLSISRLLTTGVFCFSVASGINIDTDSESCVSRIENILSKSIQFDGNKCIFKGNGSSWHDNITELLGFEFIKNGLIDDGFAQSGCARIIEDYAYDNKLTREDVAQIKAICEKYRDALKSREYGRFGKLTSKIADIIFSTRSILAPSDEVSAMAMLPCTNILVTEVVMCGLAIASMEYAMDGAYYGTKKKLGFGQDDEVDAKLSKSLKKAAIFGLLAACDVAFLKRLNVVHSYQITLKWNIHVLDQLIERCDRLMLPE